MIKVIRIIFLISFSFLSIHSSWGQEVEMIDYPTFEARINQETDQLMVYNFWATWCGPCIKELPEFERLHQEYSEKNVKVVLVSLDFANMKETALEPFVKRKELKSEVILLNAPDYNSWIDKVSPEWSGAIPATMIVKPSEGIKAFKEQSFTYEELTEWVDELLNQSE